MPVIPVLGKRRQELKVICSRPTWTTGYPESKNKEREAGKKAQWVKAFAAKLDNLISSLYIYNGRRELIPTSCTLTSTHMCTDANK